MEHYDFELNDIFDKTVLDTHVDGAKNVVKENNGGNSIEFEFAGNTINTFFNGYSGVLEKYRVINNGVLIGFLEIFRSSDWKYLSIYTNPIN